MNKDNNEPPRLLTNSQTAAYCGVTIPTLDKWVKNGWIPAALPMKKWDRKALDLALDRMSGLIVESKPKEDAFDKWKRERDARKAQRASEGH